MSHKKLHSLKNIGSHSEDYGSTYKKTMSHIGKNYPVVPSTPKFNPAWKIKTSPVPPKDFGDPMNTKSTRQSSNREYSGGKNVYAEKKQQSFLMKKGKKTLKSY